jgi:phosphoenolpyruvate carboxykinase (GTP)
MPRVFQVNWFRKGEDGGYLWPGFSENFRVLQWILSRVDGEVAATESALGLMPLAGGIDIGGLDLGDDDWSELFRVDKGLWQQEAESTAEFFAAFGDRLPAAVTHQLDLLRARLAALPE